jgi:hypothetical protein
MSHPQAAQPPVQSQHEIDMTEAINLCCERC